MGVDSITKNKSIVAYETKSEDSDKTSEIEVVSNAKLSFGRTHGPGEGPGPANDALEVLLSKVC